MIYLITISGLTEDTLLTLKSLSRGVEVNMARETDTRRLSRLGLVTRDIDRLQPMSACGLFREIHFRIVIIKSHQICS